MTGTFNLFARLSISRALNPATMSEQILRNSRGSIVGRIQSQGGKLVLKDARGSIKGYYEPNSNKTKNAQGSIVGTGNMLSTLL